MSTAANGPRICPACRAYLVPGRATCISCGMAVAKMAEYAAAQHAAGRRGDAAEGRAAGASSMVRRTMAGAGLLVLVIAGMFVYHALSTRPEPWKTYPTDRDELIRQFFTFVQEDTDPSLDKAYGLISLKVKHPDADNDEAGRYRQTLHDLARYLTGEFGPGWADTLRIAHDDDSAGAALGALVSVQTEKFHVALDLQGAAAAPADRHYGIRAIAEFPVEGAGKSQKNEVIAGVLRGYGADKSAEQLSGILGTAGSPLHETPIDTKRRLLPIVRNPNATGIQRALHQLWPVRADPTVAARLESIMGDRRYDETLRQIAKRVHDGTEDPDALIADGVVVP